MRCDINNPDRYKKITEPTFPENRCIKDGGVSPAGSELDRRAGAEYPARMLLGLHGEVRMGALHQHGRLETVPGDRSHRLQLARALAGEHLPAVDLGGTVPACVELHLLIGQLLDRHRRILDRVSAPWEAERLVGFAVRWEMSSKEWSAIMGELGDQRLAAPTDEHVGVGQQLHVPMGGRDGLLRGGVLANQLGAHLLLVEPYQDPARLYVHLRMGAVIEDGDGAVLVAPSVVLEGAPGARTHIEVALLPAEAPQDLSTGAFYLVDAPGVASGDEQVAIEIYVYGVDVEVVVGKVEIVGWLDVGLLDAY